MKPSEERYERVLRSRAGAITIAVTALAGMLFASDLVSPFPWSGNHGIIFPSPALWFSGLTADLTVLGLQLVVATLLVVMNHVYTISRSASITFAGLFLVLQAMEPSLATTLQGGPFVALVLVLASMLLLGCYNRPKRVRSIFLAFFMVSGAALAQVAFVAYLPALVVGMMQMRVFRLKGVLAAILGTVAPWWTLWCFGIMEMPHPHWALSVTFLSSMPRAALIHLIASVAVTVVFGICLTAVNLLRIMSLNSRTRSMNGWLVTLGVFTSVMLLLDSDNIAAYVTLLNVLTAFQAGSFMQIFAGKRCSYSVVTTLLVVALGLYIWALWI